MTSNKQSGRHMAVVLTVIIGIGLGYAFWPTPTEVDLAKVSRGPMALTLNEIGQTQVAQRYRVSAPVSGHLSRVALAPNATVSAGITVVASMRPGQTAPLNSREQLSAVAAIAAAQAALGMHQANLSQAQAGQALAISELQRARARRDLETISQSSLEQAQRQAEAANASVESARAAVRVGQAELAGAQAVLAEPSEVAPLPIIAPINGRVLAVLQPSAGFITAGTPIMEIGDIESDLEVVVELLSTDAVQVVPGDHALITNWGGPTALAAQVSRVEPYGFTQYSALGVEQQRVRAILSFAPDTPRPAALGHGFRVEAQIDLWRGDDIVRVPSSALFRQHGEWAALTLVDGRAALRQLTIGHDNGTLAEVIEGLDDGDQVVIYPAPALQDGARITPRTGSL